MSDFVVSMVVWWVCYELKRIWKEMVLALCTYCLGSCVERLTTAMGNLSRVGIGHATSRIHSSFVCLMVLVGCS